MYSKLLWCGASLLLDKLKPAHIENVKEIILDIDKSEAKNTIYKYTIKINNKPYIIEYLFKSNICVYGTVTITDVSAAVNYTFTVDRTTEITKYSITTSEYNEFYNCCDKCFINLTVLENKVADISTTEISTIKNNKTRFKLKHVTAAIPTDLSLKPFFIKTLFAATAAIDYDETECIDPVYIGNDRINIISFITGARRVLCLTQPRGTLKAGNIIRLINSDFKQIILHYNTAKDLTSTIEEYVLSEDDKPIRRRRYDCTCDKEATEMFDSNGSVFSIVRTDDRIIFSRMK